MNHRKTLICSVAAAALLSIYGCIPEPMPFDPAKMQQNNRQAAKELTPSPMPPISTQLETTYNPRKPGQVTSRPATVPVMLTFT